MLADFEARYRPEDVPQGRERTAASWRGVVSAWLLVALIGLGFGGLEIAMVLSPHASGTSALTGAVIPRHDPSCGAPMVPSNLTPDHCKLPTNSADQRDFLLTPGT